MDGGARKENELSFDEIKNILSQLFELGVVELEFSGGEPFMRSDLLDILRCAHEMDFVLELVTNGTLLDENKVNSIKEMTFRSIQIPLEGLYLNHEWMRGTGTFEKCLNAIKMLKQAGLFVQVRMTVTKRSLADIEKLSELLVELGVERFCLVEFTPYGRGLGYIRELALDKEAKRKFADIFYAVREKFRGVLAVEGGPYGFAEGRSEAEHGKKIKRSVSCGAIRGDWLQIMPDGTVTPCNLLPFYAGNVRHQRLSDIWHHSPVLKAFRSFDPAKLSGSCGACEYKVSCSGCRALALLFNGDFYAEDPMCIRAQGAFPSLT
jgi:radical SAM protein with 4Fe4S-binding SPASM domain